MKILDWIEEGICAVCMLVMTGLTFANVVSRHVLGMSFSFSEEITTYLFVLLSLMGTAIAAKRRTHLGLSVLTDAVNPAARKILLLIGYGIAVVFAAAIFWFGILMVKNQIMLGQKTAAMQWPEWIYGSFVPFGSLFVIIRFAQAFLEELRSKRQKGDLVV